MNIYVSSRHRVDKKYATVPKLATGWHLSFQAGYGDFQIPDTVTYLLVDVSDSVPLINPRKGMMNGLHALQMVNFLEDFMRCSRRDLKSRYLLVSCGRGRSRSTAGALVAHTMIHRDEQRAVDWLFETYPKSTPNGWILKLADDLLGTNIFDATAERFVKWTEKRPS